MKLGRSRSKSVVILLILVISPTPAYAYLDPGTGSLIVQMIIAGVATSLFVIRTKWAQIKAMFVGRVADADDPAAENSQDSRDD